MVDVRLVSRRFCLFVELGIDRAVVCIILVLEMMGMVVWEARVASSG